MVRTSLRPKRIHERDYLAAENGLATAPPYHHKQPRATVLAAVGIAHHRPRAVVNPAFFVGRSFDDRPAPGDKAQRKLRTNRLTLW